MLLPALAKAKATALRTKCANNHRQLCLAWRMYTDDNNGQLPYASVINKTQLRPYAWLNGQINNNDNDPINWDINQNVAQSPLWKYAAAAEIWTCPSDKKVFQPTNGGKGGKRVVSMGMNIYMGGVDGRLDGGVSGPEWQVFGKDSEMPGPGPSQFFVFNDQREDYITWPNSAVCMIGYPDQPERWVFRYDLPGSAHNGSGTFSFADGHAENRRWVDERTKLPLGQWTGGYAASPGNKDVFWLQDHATRKK